VETINYWRANGRFQFWLWTALAAVSWFLPLSAVADTDTYLYVLKMNPAPDGTTTPSYGTVSVIRASSDARHFDPVATIRVGRLPIQVASSIDGRKVWVTNAIDNNVSEIRTD
jgi:DNA-binding beta-propeller fold protein YncE